MRNTVVIVGALVTGLWAFVVQAQPPVPPPLPTPPREIGFCIGAPSGPLVPIAGAPAAPADVTADLVREAIPAQAAVPGSAPSTTSMGPTPAPPRYVPAVQLHWETSPDALCTVIEIRGPDQAEYGRILTGPAWATEVVVPPFHTQAPGEYCFRLYSGNPVGLSVYSDEACIQVSAELPCDSPEAPPQNEPASMPPEEPPFP
jgi:hypothetical protein